MSVAVQSAQRAYHVRKVAAGLCAYCNEPATQGKRCTRHHERHLVAMREYHRKKFGWQPWRPGGRGRPPKH